MSYRVYMYFQWHRGCILMIVLPDSTNGTCTCSNTGWVPAGYWSYNSTVPGFVSAVYAIWLYLTLYLS